MRGVEEDLIPYLERLRDLPFVMEAEVVALNPGLPAEQQADAELRLRTPLMDHCFLAEVKKTHLNREIVDGVLARMERRQDQPWILFAPHIGRPIGDYLIEQNVNFVDEVGNCRLQIGQEYLALVQGNRRKADTRGRGFGGGLNRIQFGRVGGSTWSCGVSLDQMIASLARYLTGWRAYFRFCETPLVLRNLDAWIRRRLRMVVWRQWKTGRNRYIQLRRLGVPHVQAAVAAGSPTGLWRMSRHVGVQNALRNAYFFSRGLPQLADSTMAKLS